MSVDILNEGGAILGALPVGEQVGIAFSGGLDTCCALAWMRENGAVPYAFTADLGQSDEPNVAAVPERALPLRRRGRRARRLQGRARARRARRAAVRRLPHPHRRQALLQHDAARPRSHGDAARAGDAASYGVDIWGDGSTYKGNDIERFYRYGLLANEHLRIYKPWLDDAFVSELGGRTEMSEWLAARGLPHGDLRREGVLDRREHARLDARGEGSRAARHEHEDRASRSWASRTGTASRDRARDRDDRVRGRRAGRRSGIEIERSSSSARRTRSAAATASACPTRSRTGSSRRRAAASTRRRAWRSCTSRTSGC